MRKASLLTKLPDIGSHDPFAADIDAGIAVSRKRHPHSQAPLCRIGRKFLRCPPETPAQFYLAVADRP